MPPSCSTRPISSRVSDASRVGGVSSRGPSTSVVSAEAPSASGNVSSRARTTAPAPPAPYSSRLTAIAAARGESASMRSASSYGRAAVATAGTASRLATRTSTDHARPRRPSRIIDSPLPQPARRAATRTRTEFIPARTALRMPLSWATSTNRCARWLARRVVMRLFSRRT